MGDITAGPDYFNRVLSTTYDEEDVTPGEQPTSVMEKLSTSFAEARAKAALRATGSRKPVKLTYTVVVTDVVSFGSGDAARVDTQITHDVKMSKTPAIKARGAWLDMKGNQIGKVEKQTAIQGIDGGKAATAGEKPKKKAV